MSRDIFFIADDYGLAPGVGDAVIGLIDAGRISGTSCMTGLPEWPDDAARLRPYAGRTALGLHLTLTDQVAMSGVSRLAPEGVLPSLKALIFGLSTGRIDPRAVDAELDIQHARFVAGLGRAPDFIDGHQHVHFLPAVRAWLTARHGSPSTTAKPALRGSPGLGLASPKVAAVAAMAAGFDVAMRGRGFRVIGPLAGFYDWRSPSRFEGVLRKAIEDVPDGALFMCHPGGADEILQSRDGMVAARPVERDVLGSDRFGTWLEAADARVAVLHS